MSKVYVSLFVTLGGVIRVQILCRGGDGSLVFPTSHVFNCWMVGLVMWVAEVLVFDVVV